MSPNLLKYAFWTPAMAMLPYEKTSMQRTHVHNDTFCRIVNVRYVQVLLYSRFISDLKSCENFHLDVNAPRANVEQFMQAIYSCRL